jgi:predicted PurR-regulated permease PerM
MPKAAPRPEPFVPSPYNGHRGQEPGSPAWNDAMDMRLRRYGSRYCKVWSFIGMAIIAFVVAYLLGYVWDAVCVLLIGAIMAFIYAPIVNFLERRFHVPRLLGTVVGLVTLFAVVALLVLAMVPPLTDQLTTLGREFPGYVASAQQVWSDVLGYLDTIDPVVRERIASFLTDFFANVEQLGGTLASNLGSGLVSGVSNVVSNVVVFVMGAVVSFWLAKDFPRMEREIATIVGPRIGEDYRIVTSVFGRSLGGYLKGLVITSTCTGFIAGMGFWALGIPYSGLLGVMTGVLNVIPYIGPWIGGAFAFVVGLTVGWLPALLSIVVSVVAQQFTDTFISPKVMQASVSLHPVLVIVALLAGGTLGGILGMIMAVPLTAACKGVFVYYFEKRTGRQLVSMDGAIFKGAPFADADGNPRPACDALGLDIEGDKGVPPRIKEERDRERAASAAAASEPAATSEEAGSAGR